LRSTWLPLVGVFRVADYRAYIVGDDGHFIGFEPIICRDDCEAVAKAQRLVDGHDVELWSAERFVTRLTHEMPGTVSHDGRMIPKK